MKSNRSIYVLSGACLLCFVVQADAQKSNEAVRVENVVTRCLEACEKADYAGMYRIMDAKTRRSVTPEKLASTFTHRPGEPGYELLRQPAEGKAIVIGRPAAFKLKAVSLDKDIATADFKATFTFRSKFGMDRAKFYNWLTCYLSDVPDSASVIGSLARASAQPEKPEEIDMAKGESKIFQIDPETSPGLPDIQLYYRRFVLVNEQGEWKIASAITVSGEPLRDDQDTKAKAAKK